MKKITIVIIFLISLSVNIYFGFQKEGFHEDEYYTYFSSNRSIGLYQPDREWQESQTILDEFTVKPGEGYNYGLVKLVQSWDVHPPLYYFIFHTLCSLTPGIFTKWSGIITNLIAFALSFWVLYFITKSLGVDYYLRLLVLLFWGVNPQTISCNLLIRMYSWLTFWILLCAYLHIRMILEERAGKEKNTFYKLFLPAVMITCFMGFLTQYFYLFFFVCIGFAFAIWLLFFRKEIKKALVYCCACAVSLILAVLAYPASVHHLLGGYRGNEAAGSLFNIENTVMRLSFFFGLLNDFVFAGAFWIIILIIIAGMIFGIITRKKDSDGRCLSEEKVSCDIKRDFLNHIEIWIIGFATVGYFLLTAKAALLVGSASNRYEMPIYSLVIAVTFYAFGAVLKRLFGNSDSAIADRLRYDDNRAEKRKKYYKYSCYLIAVVMTTLLVKGICLDNRVLFLYPEDRDKIQFASENEDQVVIVMFNPATPHNVWRLTDELICYSKVYYMDEENLEPIREKSFANIDKAILYVADDDLKEAAIDNLLSALGEGNNSSDSYLMKQLSEEDMWTTFLIEKK
ncbi:hypothetical protein [Butyrivibrio sp. YAB3001]|uniref:hypothetical protein n=1 Tax=Butyrivibrio sp. YAB3001 TaxID=1520812 RepID=UPI0008F6209A|nr:hypothetical protein [Butyrivibrio sp. YAB3001]SFC17226.1 hypothetical protein SAMN02910398_01637 [Butyrivibrio sp. YAB3001]